MKNTDVLVKHFYLQTTMYDPNMIVNWGMCTCSTGGTTAAIKFNHIMVAPDPVVLPGNVTGAFNVTAHTDIVAPLKADVTLEKKVLGWIKIPCIDNVGSW